MIRTLAIVGALALASCSKEVPPDEAREKRQDEGYTRSLANDRNLEDVVKYLAPKVESLEARADKWDEAMLHVQGVQSNLSRRVSDLESIKGAQVDLKSGDFDVGRHTLGLFLVRVESVAPYLDGHKVVLWLGNPTSIGWSDSKVVVRWGPSEPQQITEGIEGDALIKVLNEWNEKHTAWKAELKTTEITLLETMNSGSWTRSEVVLSPSTPAQISYLEVKVIPSSILIALPRK